ncbi:MAG: hypothetical protein IKY64_08420 [Bacteroidaceae bacterium]|nr:hypothetical protein [Bacteroidaceae bacterium]
MNAINNTFSFSRFGMVLKRDLVENRKRYIGVFFVMFIPFLAYQLQDMQDIIELSLIRTYEQGDYMASLATDLIPCFYGILSLALMCAASDMTSVPMGSKQHATNYMMMPATNLEKFLSRVLINTVMVIVMAYVALLCADLVRMLFVPFYEIKEFYGLTLPKVFVSGSDPFVEIYQGAGRDWGTVEGTRAVVDFNPARGIIAASWLGVLVLLIHSIFMLGGCIWRKAASIKTLALSVGFIFFGLWLVEQCNLSWIFHDDYLLKWYLNSSLARVLTYLLLIVPIFNWWLSFRIFSLKQVVDRDLSLKKLLKKAHS